jgi:NADH-quinone oxidoreductase subunit E
MAVVIVEEIRMPTVKEGFVQEIIERYESDPGMLIPMMQDLQAEHGYLPAEELKRLSKELGIPLTRVYGVAMFYASFRLVPKGRHEVTLCMGTVCYLKGAPRLSEAICEEYGIQPGGTTSDRLFTLQAVNCLGCCAISPVMVVDDKYHGNLTPDEALKILRALSEKEQGARPESAAAPEPAVTLAAAEAKGVRPLPRAGAGARRQAKGKAAKPRIGRKRSAAKKAEPKRAKASSKGKTAVGKKALPKAASKTRDTKKGARK